MGQGYCELELLRDADGRAVDQRYLELNPAFERLIGVPVAEARGRKASEILPELEPSWHEAFDRVARKGAPERIEHRVASLGRWFEVFAYPRGGDRLTVLYEDVTERKLAEDALRESEERQAFLLALGDAMRAQSSANAMIEVAARLLGERLNASRIIFAEFDEARGIADIFHGWFAHGAKPFPAVMRLEDYDGPILNDLRAGRTVRIHDASNPPQRRPDLAAVAELGVKALLSVPLIVGGRLVVNLSVHQRAARHWTDDEVALVQEVAERLWADLVRARTEAALRESEARLRAVVEEAPLAMAFTGTSGEILFRNPRFDQLWSRPAHVTTARSYSEVYEGYHLDGRPMASEEWPGARAVLRGEVIENEVYEIVQASGRRITCWFGAAPIRDASGGIVGGVVVFRDVTEERRIEEALRESEERYRTLVENIGGHAVFMLDADGLVIEWTASAQRVKGYAAEEVVGRHVSVFYAPEEVEAGEPERELAEAAREGRAEREAWRVRKDGERMWVSEVATAVRDAGGGLVGFTKISRDLTERRELEKERELSRARELTAMAEAAERERISRELHDRVAHHMGVAHQSLELFAALRGAAPERAEERLDLVRETTRRALDQTRSLAAELERLQEEELEGGIEAALRALAATMSDGVEVGVRSSGEESAVPEPVALQVYLAMREAIRNALRHSGCSRVGVTLEVSDGRSWGSWRTPLSAHVPIIVRGEVPDEARLDRPKQPRP